jgi:CxxC motif-containing protein
VENGEIVSLTGNLCPKGKDYAEQELRDPRRNIATSVLVLGGELPLVSVRLTLPIPKDRIFDVMEEIKALRLEAPVYGGQVMIQNVLGLGSDVIATRSVAAAPTTRL